MPSSNNNGSFTVFIYEPEFNYLKWLVLQQREIETGGDLFGLWQNENKAVVQFILGPGEHCRRTTTSFHQDVDYLEEVGGHLTSSQGLCNIGEWHSHHTLGLAEPSYGDQQTVWNHIPSVAGGRFLLFIANISGIANVNIGCFLFNSSKRKMTKGQITILPGKSPFRLTLVEKTQLTSKAEIGQDWTTFEKQSVKIHCYESASNKSTTNDERSWEKTPNEKYPLLSRSTDERKPFKRLCHKLRRCWCAAAAAVIVVIIVVPVLLKLK